jgi:hypothetical protein
MPVCVKEINQLDSTIPEIPADLPEIPSFEAVIRMTMKINEARGLPDLGRSRCRGHSVSRLARHSCVCVDLLASTGNSHFSKGLDNLWIAGIIG